MKRCEEREKKAGFGRIEAEHPVQRPEEWLLGSNGAAAEFQRLLPSFNTDSKHEPLLSPSAECAKHSLTLLVHPNCPTTSAAAGEFTRNFRRTLPHLCVQI